MIERPPAYAAAEVRRGRHYVELSQRMQQAATWGALSIITLLLIASAASWSDFLIAAAVNAVVLPANIAITHFLLPRYGPRAERWRALLNGLSCLAYIWCDWPLPAWFWQPFLAVTFDQSGGRHAAFMVGAVCLVQDAAALATGVPWIRPLAFTAFAGVCWGISSVRLRTIREMLVAAEAQRDELARAHLALKQEIAARERAELELRAAQKLEAVGRLAAGIAHEINTPIQFVGDNLQFVSEGVTDLLEVRARYAAAAGAPPAELGEALRRAAAHEAEVDVPYLAEHVPQALALASDGCRRVATIVQSMKRFAHAGPVERAPADLNEIAETALVIARHEYAHVARIERRLDPLPPITCNVGELHQVLLNLIVNAAHAIEDARGGGAAAGAAGVAGAAALHGIITLTSRRAGDAIELSIADNGSGIPSAVRDRLFEPFFTTKQVGRGTGQGLVVSRSIIERHGGSLTFTTEVGRGTTFVIRLPLEAAAADPAASAAASASDGGASAAVTASAA